MSAVAVVITGGYFAYQELGPRFLSKDKAKAPIASGQNGKTAAGGESGSATRPAGDSAEGSATGSAEGSATGSAAEHADEPAHAHKSVELEVPRLTGLTLDEARAELTTLGFAEGVLDAPKGFGCTYDDEKRDIVAVGTICNQERTPGTHVMSDARFRVVIEHDTYEHGGVELDREWHRMPDLIGMPIARAKALLHDRGFADDEFELGEARSSCGKQKVCEQRPKAGGRKFTNVKGELNLGD